MLFRMLRHEVEAKENNMPNSEMSAAQTPDLTRITGSLHEIYSGVSPKEETLICYTVQAHGNALH